MRRRLVIAAAAAITTVTLAFCVPLGLLVRNVARERAVSAAERDRSAVATAVSFAAADRAAIGRVIDGTASGRAGRVAVFMPDGTVVGAPGLAGGDVQLARRTRTPFAADVTDGVRLLRPVPAGGGTAVVVVAVPGSELHRGVTRGWLTLGLLGLGLAGLGVGVADTFGRSVTRPVRSLVDATDRVAAGDLSARVDPAGPSELARLGAGFNHLAGRIGDLVTAERENAANLSHRLRTPLTALRLDVDGVDDPAARDHLAADVDAVERAVDTVIADLRHPHRPTPRAVDLCAAVRDRTGFWAALADDQRRAHRVDIPADPVAVAVPAADLDAAIDVLLDNVFAHTPEGTPFTVSVQRAGDRARVVVADEGPGFPEAFVVARGETDGHGTGLGLDIAARAARAAGGRLEARNGRRGARVALELPVAGPGTGPAA